MQTPGLPDLIAFLPRALGVLFVEVKAPAAGCVPSSRIPRPGAGLSRGAPGVHYATGGLDAVILVLMQLGLLKPDQVASYHTTLAPEETLMGVLKYDQPMTCMFFAG